MKLNIKLFSIIALGLYLSALTGMGVAHISNEVTNDVVPACFWVKTTRGYKRYCF